MSVESMSVESMSVESISVESIYREIILDHYMRPRNRGELPEETSYTAEGENPLCGDHVKMYLDVRDGEVKEVRFQGGGCSVSVASTSMLTEVLTGRSIEDANRLINLFVGYMHGEIDTDEIGDVHEDLEAMSGIRKLPARAKCALLSWKTAQATLMRIPGALENTATDVASL